MMDDTENKVETPEQPSEVQPEPSEQVEQQAAPIKKYADSKNFKELREKASRIERERDEALRKLQELESKNQSDDDIDVDSEALVEGKHLKKTYKRIKQLEQELNTFKQKSDAAVTEARLKAQFPDFDTVVTKENIESLKEQYPELTSAITLEPGKDVYSTAVSAYTLIRKLGIAPEDTFRNDRAAAQKNSLKPRSVTSVSPQQGESPLSRANAFANGLTDDLKQQLWKEMEEARRQG